MRSEEKMARKSAKKKKYSQGIFKIFQKCQSLCKKHLSAFWMKDNGGVIKTSYWHNWLRQKVINNDINMHKFIEKQKSTILQFRKQISTFGWEVKKKWPEIQRRRRNIPGGFFKISKNVNPSAKSIWVSFEWKTMVE